MFSHAKKKLYSPCSKIIVGLILPSKKSTPMNIKNILPILLILVIASCGEDDNPTPADGNTKVIGEKVYRLLQGEDQTGVLGQALAEEIHVKVTNIEGRPILAHLQVEASDPGAEVVVQRSPEEEDVFIIQWRLGCDETRQTLTIKDNVCGIAKEGCIDVDIFEITVTTGSRVSGWFESCQYFYFSHSAKLHASDRWLGIVTVGQVHSTSNPRSGPGQWLTSRTPAGTSYSRVQTAPSGEIYFPHNSDFYISEDRGQNWTLVDAPIDRYHDNKLFILGKNDYACASAYSDEVYLSTDKGRTWDLLVDISQITYGQSNGLQSIASDGDKIYVLVDNNRIIEISGGSATVIEFDYDSWPRRGGLWDYQTLIQDNKIFHMYRNDVIYEIDPGSNSASKILDMPRPSEMILSLREIYLVNNSNSYYKYQNGSFVSKTFSLPAKFSNNPYLNIRTLTFYQGSPAFIDSDGKLFYYIN